ncbi:MAG: hypothetical protein DRN81_03590, partial [Thermoproteota archaeon]
MALIDWTVFRIVFRTYAEEAILTLASLAIGEASTIATGWRIPPAKPENTKCIQITWKVDLKRLSIERRGLERLADTLVGNPSDVKIGEIAGLYVEPSEVKKVRAGPGKLILITGNPGTGKTMSILKIAEKTLSEGPGWKPELIVVVDVESFDEGDAEQLGKFIEWRPQTIIVWD